MSILAPCVASSARFLICSNVSKRCYKVKIVTRLQRQIFQRVRAV